MQLQRRMRSPWYGGSRRGWPLVKYGMIVFGIGVLITIGTYAFAVGRGGGTYLVSYGPMLVGVYCMARGGFDMSRQRRAAAPAQGRAAAMAGAGTPAYGAHQGDPRQPYREDQQPYRPDQQSYRADPRQGRAGYGQDTPASAAGPQPNWYPDPGNPAMLRWWDGQAWTPHTQPRPFN